MGQQSGQPSYGQAPTNGPMPGGNPSLGGANMPSMQGPAVNVPQLYQMLAQMQGGGGMPGQGGQPGLADAYMPGQQGGMDTRGMPPMPGSQQRAPMPGGNPGMAPGMPMQRAPMQRPPMMPPQGGAPPMRSTMPGQPGGGGMPQITPDMIAAMRARGGGGMGGGLGAGAGGSMGTPSLGMLDLLGMGGGGQRGGGNAGPSRRRA